MENINIYYCIIGVLVIFLIWVIKAFFINFIRARLADLDLEFSDYMFLYKNKISIGPIISAQKKLKEMFISASFKELASHIKVGGNLDNVVTILKKADYERKVLTLKEAMNIDLIKSMADKYESMRK